MEFSPKETINEIVNKPPQKQIVTILLWLLIVQYIAIAYLIKHYDNRELEVEKRTTKELNYLKGKLEECQKGRDKITMYTIDLVAEKTKEFEQMEYRLEEIRKIKHK